MTASADPFDYPYDPSEAPNQWDNNTFAGLIDGGLDTAEEWGRACDDLADAHQQGALGWPDSVAAGLWTLFAERARDARATEDSIAEIAAIWDNDHPGGVISPEERESMDRYAAGDEL